MQRNWHLRRGTWKLPTEGAIMGIVNTTPDSFSDGGRYLGLDAAVMHAEELIHQGALIIDIGGESTRPGAQEVSIDEELARTLPVIESLRDNFHGTLLSIDTRHVEVARAALEVGVDIINDVTGLADPQMRELCAQYGCGVILMHMQGEPHNMQKSPHYEDVVREIREFFIQRIRLAEAAGIKRSSICIDPGIGFGKTLEHNLEIISQLESLRPTPEIPLLMALSRKRMLSTILHDMQKGRSALATVSMSLMAAERGADLHRVHDVAEMHQALELRRALLSQKSL